MIRKVDNILTTEQTPKLTKIRTNLHFWPRYQKREKPLKTLIKSTFSRVFSLAEKERFELSNRFWRLHDFQSCALDQLGDFSKYSVVAHRDSYIIPQASAFVNTFFYFFSHFWAAKMPQRLRMHHLGYKPQPCGTFLDFHSIYKAGSSLLLDFPCGL